MDVLNTVDVTVNIAGKDIHFIELELHEEYNNHSHCKILVDFEELDTGWLANPVSIIKNIGEDIIVTMSHKVTKETNVFRGIVSNIGFQGKHGTQNQILIQAISETIKLDGQPTMDSFTGRQLSDIVREVVANSGNGASININTRYKNPIEYISMYDETPFEFLNRLSYLYGENFFYDGTDIHFGYQMLDDAIPIKYDVEMTSFNLETKLLPSKLSRYKHLVHDSQDWIKDTKESLHEATGYLKVAYDKSKEFFYDNAIRPLQAGADNSNTIRKNVEIEQIRTTAEMLILSGTTQTCKIKIGKVVYVDFPKSMSIDTTAGNFLITKITHKVSQEGYYSNSFSSVRAALDYVPVANVKFPKINSERAVVVDNADPAGKGRVRVAFQWQSYLQKETHWIRVQTIDGGGTEAVPQNRGLVFIPEIGDEVMVCFENLDPSQPYVSGSIFAENKSIGGGIKNHQKSIMTRSGIKIILNDQQKSVHVQDPSGNKWFMDGQGNIEVTAPNMIKLNGTNIQINAGNDLSVSVKNNYMTSVGQIFNLNASMLNQNIATAYNLQSATAFLGTKENIQLQSDEITALGTGMVTIHSDNSIIANSLGVMDLFSNDAMTLAQAAQPNPPTPLTSISLGVVNFRPLSTYDGEYGVDWYRIADYVVKDFPGAENFSKTITSGYVSPPVGTPAGTIINLSDVDAKSRAYSENYYRALPVNHPSGHSHIGNELKKDYFPLFLNIYSEQAKDKIMNLYTAKLLPYAPPTPVFEVDLDCNIEVFEDLDKIEVELEQQYLEIDNPVLQNAVAAGTKVKIQRKITCRMNFTDPLDTSIDTAIQNFGFKNEQEIIVWGYPKDSLAKSDAEQKTLRKTMGRIVVMPNDITHRKHIDVVYANVIIKMDASTPQTGTKSMPADVKDRLHKALHQALITCTITEGADSNLTADPMFKIESAAGYTAASATKKYSSLANTYIYPDGFISTLIDNKTSNGAFDHIRNEYIRQHPEYANHYMVFHIDIEHKLEYWDGTKVTDTKLAGQVKDIGSKCVIVFKDYDTQDAAVIAHEILHCLNLEHSFDNSNPPNSENLAAGQELVFKRAHTTNIMDYSDKLLNLWRWQWKISQDGLNNELEFPSILIDAPIPDNNLDESEPNDILMA